MRGVDKKSGPTELENLRPYGVEAIVQVGDPEVSTLDVITDAVNVQLMTKTTYVSVPSQGCPNVSLVTSGVDVETGGTGIALPPLPVVPTVTAVLGPVRAQAILV